MLKSCYGLIAIFLFFFFAGSISAIEFKNSLRVGESLKYKHWNIKKQQIIGYSVLEYSVFLEEGKEYILESNQNMDEKGVVYSQKRSLFDFKTGRLERYDEKDLRTGLQISDQFKYKRSNTKVIGKNKSKI